METATTPNKNGVCQESIINLAISRLFGVLALAICFFLVPVSGRTTSYEDVQRVITSQRPLQVIDLIQISLLFSGVSERDLQSHTTQILKYLAEVQPYVKARAKSDYELGRSLLAYLHETRLKRYDSSQSAIHTMLKKGKFNCLSSTALYLICARSLGLTVEPISAPNHVFLRMKNGDSWIDVETTTKYGFHPGTRNEFFDEFGRLTGSTYIPPQNYRDREIITERQLFSLMLQAQLPEKDPNILRVAIDWYMFVPTRDAQRNLQYAYSNYVDWLNDEDLYDHATRYVINYKRRFQSDPALRKSVEALLHRQILFFIEKKRWRSTEELLDESTNVLAADLKQAMAENLLAKAMQEGKRKKQYASVLDLTSRLIANGHLPKTRGEDYVNYLNAQQQVLARGK